MAEIKYVIEISIREEYESDESPSLGYCDMFGHKQLLETENKEEAEIKWKELCNQLGG